MRGVSPRKRKVEAHAVNSTPGSSYRGGCSVVAGQSVHSHARIVQVNPEWCGGHCRSAVAAERIWTVSLPFRRPYRKRMTHWQVTVNAPSHRRARSNSVPAHSPHVVGFGPYRGHDYSRGSASGRAKGFLDGGFIA